jgi:hypothetical protein
MDNELESSDDFFEAMIYMEMVLESGDGEGFSSCDASGTI